MKKIKNKKSNKKVSKTNKIISLILLITSLIFAIIVTYINIVSLKYLWIVYFVISFIDITCLSILLSTKKGKIIKNITSFLAFLLVLLFSLGISYILKTMSFFENIYSNKKTDIFYVMVLNNDKYNDIKDLENSNIGTYSGNISSYDQALTKLEKEVTFFSKNYSSLIDIYKGLTNNHIDAMFISKSYKELLEHVDPEYESKVKVIYEINIITKTKFNYKKNDITKNSFNIYISGIDQYGTISESGNSDVNIIMTVNPRTNKILLTSIPRDYYVNLHNTTGYRDKLTHSGMYGIEMSLYTLEDLFDIDINYYVKVNFSTLEDLIDVIGGITVYSDYSFVPSTNPEYYFKVGYNELDGSKALAFARERKSFAEGDRIRGKNQQKIIKAIIDKITSSKTLIMKYDDILESLSDSFITNMSSKEMTSLIKYQLNNMPSWDIDMISVTGSDSMNYTYSFGSSMPLYVMEPDISSVNKAKDKINSVASNK